MTRSRPDSPSGYNAASFTTKNLYVLVRPKTAWASAGYGPALLRQPQSGTVLLGTPLTLEAYAPGSVFYQWMRDGVAMPKNAAKNDVRTYLSMIFMGEYYTKNRPSVSMMKYSRLKCRGTTSRLALGVRNRYTFK